VKDTSVKTSKNHMKDWRYVGDFAIVAIFFCCNISYLFFVVLFVLEFGSFARQQ